MENIFRYLFGGLCSIISLLAPIEHLVLCAIIFVGIDFVTGVAASNIVARRNNTQWAFESSKAWTTILKLCFVLGGIVLSWMIDSYILPFMQLNLANLFTGFVCGVEFWSYLENAALISNHPIFRYLKRFMRTKIEKSIQ